MAEETVQLSISGHTRQQTVFNHMKTHKKYKLVATGILRKKYYFTAHKEYEIKNKKYWFSNNSLF